MSTVPMMGESFLTPIATSTQLNSVNAAANALHSATAVPSVDEDPVVEDPVVEDHFDEEDLEDAKPMAVASLKKHADDRRLHRIAEVRQQQGMSLRSVSRRTGIEVRRLKQMEDPAADISLSELLAWQDALDVPIADLLVDSDQPLSQSIQQRAQLVKIMKTAVAIAEVNTSTRINRLAEMLREQLVQLMPELATISGWPNYGQRRATNQMGRIAEEPIATNQISLDSLRD